MRTAMVVVVLATLGYAQTQTPATQSSTPAAQQPAQAGTAQPGAVQPQGPQPRRLPQAKTQPEFDEYNTAKALATDPAAIDKAAHDFAAKYPDSELRVLLYREAMHAYQRANNAQKMMDMGHEVLKLDADDPEALIGVAEVLTERSQETDLDYQQRVDEANKLAQRALETVDVGIIIPVGTPPEKVEAYKNFLRSSAYAVLGTQQYNKQKYVEAENYFRKSIDAFPSQPDSIVVLRLALSLDQQGKYPEALKEANHAVELTTADTVVGKYARDEQKRLVQLTQGTSGAPPAAPPTGAPAPPNK